MTIHIFIVSRATTRVAPSKPKPSLNWLQFNDWVGATLVVALVVARLVVAQRHLRFKQAKPGLVDNYPHHATLQGLYGH